MKILKKAEKTLAYGKVGILGFQGSGKTFTAAQIAIGIASLTKNQKMAFFDTETGSSFLLEKLEAASMEVFEVKSRAFSDLLETIKECEENQIGTLIIDSITHVWRDLCESYDKKLNRHGRLQFQDWAVIKREWQQYTDAFVNSRVHIIVCGRAGYEYDYDFNEDGSKDLIKTDVKMKVENEFGFEPSLVILMERSTENRAELESMPTRTKQDRQKKQLFKPKVNSKWIHRAHVLKDRTDTINGQSFDYPTFDNFEPHFRALNLGGFHLGVNTNRDSSDRFDNQGRGEWQRRQKEKEIALEEIQGHLAALWPGTTKEEKLYKQAAVEVLCGKPSWTHLSENTSIDQLKIFAQGLELFRQQFPEVLANAGEDFLAKPPLEQVRQVWGDCLQGLAQLNRPAEPEEQGDIQF